MDRVLGLVEVLVAVRKLILTILTVAFVVLTIAFRRLDFDLVEGVEAVERDDESDDEEGDDESDDEEGDDEEGDDEEGDDEEGDDEGGDSPMNVNTPCDDESWEFS